jgi:hypothetical protein
VLLPLGGHHFGTNDSWRWSTVSSTRLTAASGYWRRDTTGNLIQNLYGRLTHGRGVVWRRGGINARPVEDYVYLCTEVGSRFVIGLFHDALVKMLVFLALKP